MMSENYEEDLGPTPMAAQPEDLMDGDEALSPKEIAVGVLTEYIQGQIADAEVARVVAESETYRILQGDLSEAEWGEVRELVNSAHVYLNVAWP